MPSERPVDRNGQAHTDEELYELTEDGRLPSNDTKLPQKYEEGSSIDWLHEEAVERERTHALRSQAGARGLLLPLLESTRLWFVVIMAGFGIGITGAWLDVLVKWYVLLARH
jgi:chloride channel 3/4/5